MVRHLTSDCENYAAVLVKNARHPLTFLVRQISAPA